LQAPWPLQALEFSHFTSALSAAWAVLMAAAVNRVAAAAAMASPDRFFMDISSRVVVNA
jgi:hypothetical protein